MVISYTTISPESVGGLAKPSDDLHLVSEVSIPENRVSARQMSQPLVFLELRPRESWERVTKLMPRRALLNKFVKVEVPTLHLASGARGKKLEPVVKHRPIGPSSR